MLGAHLAETIEETSKNNVIPDDYWEIYRLAVDLEQQASAENSKNDAAQVAVQLAQCLRFADVVKRALPIDEEAEKMVSKSMSDRHKQEGPPRKLIKKKP